VPSIERPQRGLLDTSVIIDLEKIPVTSLPREVAIIEAGGRWGFNPPSPPTQTWRSPRLAGALDER
jgi:hypothetical protein